MQIFFLQKLIFKDGHQLGNVSDYFWFAFWIFVTESHTQALYIGLYL